jgi:hypothetical protein
MEITFGDTKECSCYGEFVNNSSDRNIIKKFTKLYSNEIRNSATKLHERLKNSKTAADYQMIYGRSENRIELKTGVKNKEPLVLKIRVTESYRKFFHYVLCPTTPKYLLTEAWKGQFSEITHIHIYDVNKHKYD